MFAILFLIALNPLFWGLFEQAGGSLNLFTDRFVDRSGVPASHVPVDQPDLHHPARAGVRRAVAVARQARARAVGPGQVRPGAGAGRAWLPRVGVGRESVGSGAMTPVIFVFLIYLLAHHRRAVPLAGRPVGDEPACADHLASLIMGAWFYMTAVGQLRRRQDRRGDRRRERRDDQGELTLAIYSQIGWIAIGVARRRPRAEPDREALDAPRHAAGTAMTGSPRRAAGELPSRRPPACTRRTSPPNADAEGRGGMQGGWRGRRARALVGPRACATAGESGAGAGSPGSLSLDLPRLPGRRRPRSSARPSTTAQAGGSTSGTVLIAEGKVGRDRRARTRGPGRLHADRRQRQVRHPRDDRRALAPRRLSVARGRTRTRTATRRRDPTTPRSLGRALGLAAGPGLHPRAGQRRRDHARRSCPARPT